MTPEDKSPDGKGHALYDRIVQALLDFISQIPNTKEAASDEPLERARAIAGAAARKAALVSGTLALPLGPVGWVTILPDLIEVWRIQRQMIADLAGVFGKTPHLSQETMLYCMFRHAAAHAVRGLVVRVGERILIRRASLRVLQGAANRIGMKLTQRLIGKGISRWLPILGALGVAGFAYFDTGQVASTAIDLFGREIDIDPGETRETT